MRRMANPSQSRPLRTIVYIDGFNLYYGALKKGRNGGRKWLDLEEWATKVFKPVQYDIKAIKFFTAKVFGNFDPAKKVRQEFYWRALATLPKVKLILGKYQNTSAKIQLTADAYVCGRVPKEKGTDVNLATHLVNDAHLGVFDVAVVVTNDSDLCEAIRIVSQDVKRKVIVINPCPHVPPCIQITRCINPNDHRTIRMGQILSSQFPPALTDGQGIFTKPKEW